MADGKSLNGVDARTTNLEGWVKRIDNKVDEFLENKKCGVHEAGITEAKKMANDAENTADDAKKLIKGLLISLAVGMLGIISGLIFIIIQNASKAGP
jgi:hypothetical protein